MSNAKKNNYLASPTVKIGRTRNQNGTAQADIIVARPVCIVSIVFIRQYLHHNFSVPIR